MPRLNPKRRVKKTVHLDEELYHYFLGLRYSPTEDRIKYGFSDLVNALLYVERDRQIAQARLAREQADAPPTA